MKSQKSKRSVPSLLRDLCALLEDKKAGEVKILSMGALSSITDYLVLATGTSEPHLRALRVELEKVIDKVGIRIVGMDTEQGSGWLVIDAFDVMVHVFTEENRRKYALETLWKDAEEIPLSEVLGAPKKVVRKAKKAPAKKAKPAARAKKAK